MSTRSAVVAADAVNVDVVMNSLVIVEEEKDEVTKEVTVMEEAKVMVDITSFSKQIENEKLAGAGRILQGNGCVLPECTVWQCTVWLLLH